MLTPDEMRAKIMDRAADDADFRARLLSDPKGAVEEELGFSIPSEFNVEVHEDGGDTAHLVLPPPSRLGEADLEALAGGAPWGAWNTDDW